MNVLTLQSTYGGLLHDTGKAVYRAGGQRGSHSEQGYQFLHGVLPGADWAPVLDCVRYHHAAALRGAAKHCQPIPRRIWSIWPTCFPARLTAGRPKAKAMPTGGSFRWMRCSPT